jgi:WhiB family redox-sensing transcriptional regulator
VLVVDVGEDIKTLLIEGLMAPGPAPVTLLDLLRRPGWMADAACRERPDLDWVPGRGADLFALKDVCAGCPVQPDCLAYALAVDPWMPGIWGGFGPHQRARIARGAAAPVLVRRTERAARRPRPARSDPDALGRGRCPCGRTCTGAGDDRLRSGLCPACSIRARRQRQKAVVTRSA